MSTYDINLLVRKKKKTADKLLYFILHYFRYIIVITQIVVISVFFYRFSEDQKIIDLKESFKQKQQILSIMQPVVDEAQAIQKNSEQVAVLLDKQDIFLKRFEIILSIIPQEISVMNFSINDSGSEIHGLSKNLISIRSFNRRIKESKEIENSQIKTVNKIDDNNYDFNVSISFIKK